MAYWNAKHGLLGSSANLLDVHLQKEEVAVKVVYL